MLKLKEIIYQAAVFASRYRFWWVLSFCQVVALSIIGKYSKLGFLHLPYLVWLITAIVLLQPITAWLWLEIESRHEQKTNTVPLKIFIKLCIISGGLSVASEAVLIFARWLYLDWAFLSLLSSFVAATVTLAILYIVLCRQSLVKSIILALDTWHKKISLAVMAALILIFAHGISYVLVHTIGLEFPIRGEFSALHHSATIWILLLGLSLAISYLAAFLNSFLVILFLNIIKRQKVPEEQPVPDKVVALEGNY